MRWLRAELFLGAIAVALSIYIYLALTAGTRQVSKPTVLSTSYESQRKYALECREKCRERLKHLYKSLQKYRQDQGHYPSNLIWLGSDPPTKDWLWGYLYPHYIKDENLLKCPTLTPPALLKSKSQPVPGGTSTGQSPVGGFMSSIYYFEYLLERIENPVLYDGIVARGRQQIVQRYGNRLLLLACFRHSGDGLAGWGLRADGKVIPLRQDSPEYVEQKAAIQSVWENFETETRTACKARLSQLYTAIQRYRKDHNGDYPLWLVAPPDAGAAGARLSLYPRYVSDKKLMRCPKWTPIAPRRDSMKRNERHGMYRYTVEATHGESRYEPVGQTGFYRYTVRAKPTGAHPSMSPKAYQRLLNSFGGEMFILTCPASHKWGPNMPRPATWMLRADGTVMFVHDDDPALRRQREALLEINPDAEGVLSIPPKSFSTTVPRKEVKSHVPTSQ